MQARTVKAAPTFRPTPGKGPDYVKMLRKRLDKLRLTYAPPVSVLSAAATWLVAGILGGGFWWLYGWFLALGVFVLVRAIGGHKEG
jgi:fatty acid desaturase